MCFTVGFDGIIFYIASHYKTKMRPLFLQHKYRWKFSKCLPIADAETITSTMFILFGKLNKLRMGDWRQILFITISLTY